MVTTAQAYIRNVKISPKKLRFMLSPLKKLKPYETLDYLMYSPQRSAKILYKVIKSAMNNARNILKTDDHNFQFKLFNIEEGQKLKRFKAGGRGTAKPIIRRFSQIKIVLNVDKAAKEKQNLTKLKK